MELLFKGQVDGGIRTVCFKVIVPRTTVDVILMFLITEQQPRCGISIIAKTSRKEHELPMNFISGTGYYYNLEVFGLIKKGEDKEYYDFAFFKNRRFTVSKSASTVDLNFNIPLEEHICPYFPLNSFPQDSVSMRIAHKPVSKYTIKCPGRYDSKKTFIIILKQNPGKLQFFIHTGRNLRYNIPFDLPPAKACEVKVIMGFTLFEFDDIHIIGNELNNKGFSFRTFFTKSEYKSLYEKTLEFTRILQGKFHSIDFLYRNKSEMYFSSIMEYHGGIMKPYKKDHNGDPCSVINGSIDGLFFSTAMDFQTLKPLAESLYGPIRLHIDAASLFTPNMNLYFADFYCHYQVHYVSVVLTPKRSPTDKFCEERLLSLDIYNNPFMYLTESKEDFYDVMVYLSNGLRVEVFYTEPINIRRVTENQKGHFERVPIIGRGESRPTGIPKNRLCKTCNL